MGGKNACALEFACILGRKIKCSVIIIINSSNTVFFLKLDLKITTAQ